MPAKRQAKLFRAKNKPLSSFFSMKLFRRSTNRNEDAASAKSNAIKQMFVKAAAGKRDQICSSQKSDVD